MRPKKSVGERLRPDEANVARPNVRLRVVGILAIALLALMLIRLWYLQVLDATAANHQVITNEVRVVPLPAPRGLILDRGDNVLVGDGVSEDITLSRVAALADPAVIGRLALLSGETTAQVNATLGNLIYSPYLPVPVIQGATPSEIAYVREHQSMFPGVQVTEESQRTYPEGNLAAQVLGYVDVITGPELNELKSQGYNSNSDLGQSGIEAQYESVLRGKAGSATVPGERAGDCGRNSGRDEPGVRRRRRAQPGHEAAADRGAGSGLSDISPTARRWTRRANHPVTLRQPTGRRSCSIRRMVRCSRWPLTRPTTRVVGGRDLHRPLCRPERQVGVSSLF
jgi:hypothetical protein